MRPAMTRVVASNDIVEKDGNSLPDARAKSVALLLVLYEIGDAPNDASGNV